jgi:CubicO group peptidase (beta-lactamase class C family)
MTFLEQAVQAIECGLLPAIRIEGRPQQPLKLCERMARYKVPGFGVALIEQGEIAATRSFGVLEAGGELVTGETLFQAASISKAVSAMAALHLVEAGMLDLDADVNEALRSWQVPENEHTQTHKVTLRGLLSHTAGLTVKGFRGYKNGQELPTLQQVLNGEPPANSRPVRVAREPGKAYKYSSGSDLVVQQLLEDVTGEPFADLMQELIFDKLGMAHSTFEQPLSEAYAAGAATAHRRNGKPVPGRWHIYPELAAAGLWTTPSDLARLVVEVLRSYAGASEDASDAVLSVEMTRQMLTLTPAKGAYAYGLGFFLVEIEGGTRFHRPGWNEGYHCFMGGHTGTGHGIALMTNGENGKLLALEVLRGLAGLFHWPDFQPKEKAVAQVDPAIYVQFEGQYQNANFPDYGVVIVKQGHHLFIEGGPDGLRCELYPISKTAFYALDWQEAITFVRDADGNVKAVRVGDYERLNRTG